MFSWLFKKKKKPIHQTKNRHVITMAEVFKTLIDYWPKINPHDIKLADGMYVCPTRAEVEKILFESKIDEMIYRAEIADCFYPETSMLCRYDNIYSIESVENLYDLYLEGTQIEVLDPENKWQRVTQISIKETSKHKATICNDGGVIVTTDNHKIWDQNHVLTPVSELDSGPYFDKADILEKVPIDNNFQIMGQSVDPDMAWALGIFCADGHARRRNSNSKYIILSLTDKKYLDRALISFNKYFANTFMKTNFKSDEKGNVRGGVELKNKQHKILFSPCKGKKGTPTDMGLRERNNDVMDFFEQFYDNRQNKKVPNYVLTWSVNLQAAFLEGYWAGNGSRKGMAGQAFPESVRITVPSAPIAQQLYLLYHHTGYSQVWIRSYSGKNAFDVAANIQDKQGPRSSFIRTTFSDSMVYDITVERGLLKIGNFVAKNCDNFAVLLYAYVLRKRYEDYNAGLLPRGRFYSLTFGEVWYKDPLMGPHALNVAITSDAGILFIEPQTDRIWKAERSAVVDFVRI